MNKLRIKGSIGDLMDKIEVLQNNSWIDNRTRAVISEFNVYNAQVKYQYSNDTIWRQINVNIRIWRQINNRVEEAKNYN
jgi:hypothetical protein